LIHTWLFTSKRFNFRWDFTIIFKISLTFSYVIVLGSAANLSPKTHILQVLFLLRIAQDLFGRKEFILAFQTVCYALSKILSNILAYFIVSSNIILFTVKARKIL